MVKLEADCKLISLIPSWDAARSLRINSGVRIARRTRWEKAALSDFAFGQDSGAYPPKDDWRLLTHDETSELIGITDGDNLAATVQLFEIPGDLRSEGLQCVKPYLSTPSPEDKEKGFASIPETATREFFARFNEWVFQNIYALSEEHRHQVGIAARLPGHASSTGWEGLHTDIWGPSMQKQMSPGYMGSRLVLNLGQEKRQFVFHNLRLASMVRRYPEILASDPIRPLKDRLMAGELKQSFVGYAFLEMYPDYPVISVTLEPGQGYSAPTTSCLHDGYLSEMRGPDISLRTGHSGARGQEGAWSAPVYVQQWKDLCFGALRSAA